MTGPKITFESGRFSDFCTETIQGPFMAIGVEKVVQGLVLLPLSPVVSPGRPLCGIGSLAWLFQFDKSDDLSADADGEVRPDA